MECNLCTYVHKLYSTFGVWYVLKPMCEGNCFGKFDEVLLFLIEK